MFVGTAGRPLLYIRRFVSALFPDKGNVDGMTTVFDILYDEVKSFQSYVEKKIKQRLMPEMQMELCGEIRKHFSPWSILKVLDTTNQSLNQVRYNFIINVCDVYFLYTISNSLHV